MVTRPTPETCEIFWARMLSAASFTWSSGSDFDDTDRVSTGWSAGLLFEYVGGAGRVRGSRFDAALMAACTSCSAASMLRSSSNCRVICEVPKLEIEVICASAGICPNCGLSGVVTAEAIVSALAPGRNVEARMVGYSTCGGALTGSSRYPIIPASRRPTVSSAVATGRRMKGSEMLTAGVREGWSAANRRVAPLPHAEYERTGRL